MASYVVPQVEIHQLFSEIPVALTQNQIPFVFGPNYLLHRYDAAGEKAGTYVGEYEYTDTARFCKYPGVLDDEKVDTSYTKLIGNNVVVQLAEITTVNRVTEETSEDSSASSGSSEHFYIRSISEADAQAAASIVLNKLALTIPEDMGLSEISTGRMLRLYKTGSFIDAKITDVVYETNSSDTDIAIVTIDEYIPTNITITKADLCEVQNDVEFPRKDPTDENKTARFWKEDVDALGENGVKIVSALKTKIVDEDFVTEDNKGYAKVLTADIYLTYREIVNSASDTIHSITGASEVVNALGAVHPDNPLAQAVYNAALNAGGQTVRYMAVPTNDIEGYSRVLNAASLTKEVYFMVPVTRDSAVLDLVQAHVNSMSAATTKRWRIAFVSAEIPDTDPIYNADASTSGKDFKSLVVSVDPVKKNAIVQFVIKNGDTLEADPNTKFKKDLKGNDTLRTSFNHKEYGEVVPQDYKILKVMSNNTVLVDDPNGELTVDTDAEDGKKTEIYHTYTNAEKAEVIRDLSSSFADRRMYNVFPSVFSTNGVQQTGEFAAACVAGLVASCLPQQPVTNLEIVGIDDIPLVYQTFSFEELNTMASGGTFIVMQDLPNDQVYVRHQISTDYEANNLNTAELSITKNLDSISYFFDDLLSPYIGKYNITPELLTILHAQISNGIAKLSSNSYGLYGSQLIYDGTEILLLEQDALLKDHVNCNLQLNMPYPFNHLVLKLFV